MGYKFIDDNTLNNIAQAIRNKTESQDRIACKNFANQINNISTGSAFMKDKNSIALAPPYVYIGEGFELNNGGGNRILALANSYITLGGGIVNELIIPNKVTNMAGAFAGGYSCYNYLFNDNSKKFPCGPDVINMSRAFTDSYYLKGQPNCGPNVKDMSFCWNWCSQSLYGQPICGPNVTNMLNTYAFCQNLTGDAASGPNVIDMDSTYYQCDNLTGNAACGDNVINFNNTYFRCINLRMAACGNNVKYMTNTYFQCYSLLGNAACGPNVKSMNYTYQDCYNLEKAACGDNVIYMDNTYQNCYKLKEGAIGNNVLNAPFAYFNCFSMVNTSIGTNVKNLFQTFMYCSNLKEIDGTIQNAENLASAFQFSNNLNFKANFGDFLINASYSFFNCGDNVTIPDPLYISVQAENLSSAFSNCPNINGNIYFKGNSPFANISSCFYGRSPLNRLNLYVKPDSTWNSVIYNNYGAQIDWTLDEENNCYYDQAQNVYVYYNYIRQATQSMPFEYYKTPVVIQDVYPNIAINIYYTFADSPGTTGNPECSDNVVDFNGTYYNCSNITGSAKSGLNVKNMTNTYHNCYNINYAACGDNVISFDYAYTNCYNLLNSACGNNVTNMYKTYENCNNIIDGPSCGPNVINMAYAYSNCCTY